ncbi:MAG: hypothetical protein JWL64_40 [Frankiales bacterium]|jgi:hypothetical protein|nr:hypothetical protein [Frankiales bacterium]
MTTDEPDEQKPDDSQQYDIHLADGLSPEQADEALRIFAALRVTREARHAQADESGALQILCSVLLADDTPCLLPLPHDEHRTLGSTDQEGASP